MSGTSVSWTGNVTRDPEVRFSAQGNAWATFAIAVDNYVPGADKDKPEATFINVKVLNGDLATNVAESVVKGTRVSVTGQVKVEPWTDKEGVKRTSVTLVANDVAVSLRWARATVAAAPRTTAPAPHSAAAPAAAPF